MRLDLRLHFCLGLTCPIGGGTREIRCQCRRRLRLLRADGGLARPAALPGEEAAKLGEVKLAVAVVIKLAQDGEGLFFGLHLEQRLQLRHIQLAAPVVRARERRSLAQLRLHLPRLGCGGAIGTLVVEVIACRIRARQAWSQGGDWRRSWTP